MYQNGLTETIYYAGTVEYNTTGQLSRIATGEGMIYPSMKSGNQIFQYQYYLPDHLGNVRVLFNDRGDTLQNTDYYPYGLAITNKSLFGGQRYLYNGKEVQTETNEYDFGARFYDPSTGRWHTMDPMSQFASPYDYVGGDPINMIDPNGMWGEWLSNLFGPVKGWTNGGLATALNEVVVTAPRLAQTSASVIPLAVNFVSPIVGQIATASIRASDPCPSCEAYQKAVMREERRKQDFLKQVYADPQNIGNPGTSFMIMQGAADGIVQEVTGQAIAKIGFRAWSSASKCG